MQFKKLIPHFFKAVLLDIKFPIIFVSPRKPAGMGIFLFSWHSGFQPHQSVNYFSVPISTRLKKKTHVIQKILNFKMSDFSPDLFLYEY